jgi:hypothetical protein
MSVCIAEGRFLFMTLPALHVYEGRFPLLSLSLVGLADMQSQIFIFIFWIHEFVYKLMDAMKKVKVKVKGKER